MSGTWQTFLDKLSIEKDETSYLTEICDCNDGTCQLFYNSRNSKFNITGTCNEMKLCAQIMKDKHLAKIQSHRFRKMERTAKNDRGTNKSPAAGMEPKKQGTKKPRENKDSLQYKSLTAFF